MLILGAVFVILIGAALGSFANVLVVRFKEESSILGRSQCLSCKKPIKPIHLVPIVSWFLLRGKCAMCKKPINPQYPIVESAAVILSLAAFVRHMGQPLEEAVPFITFEILLSFILLVIVTFDLRWQLIPLEFSVVSAIVLAAYRILLGADTIDILLGAVVISVALGILVFITGSKMMGEGDPIVGLILGVALGFPAALAGLLIAFVIGGAVSAALLIQGNVTRKTAIPFTPFLAIGTLFAIWWSGPLAILLGYA